MAKRIFTKEIKEYILSEIRQRGAVSAEDVAEIIRGLHIYDPVSAEIQWCKARVRQLMTTWKDKDGIRILFATGTGDAEFVNIETCQVPSQLDAVEYQLTKKKDGINRALKKNDRCKAALTGQTPLYREREDGFIYLNFADFLR